MKRKLAIWAGVISTALVVSGCATGRNYQTDVDSMNAKISAMQGQLDSKDQEIAKLQNQVNDQRDSQRNLISQLESDKRELASRLDQALSDAARLKDAKKTVAKAYDSDLK